MAYSKEQWIRAKGFFEAGLSLQDIANKVGFKSRDTVQKRAKKENWQKDKILQDKTDIIELEKENSTISAKNSTMIQKISTLETYQIDILSELVEDSLKQKSILLTGLNMAMIRSTQKLQSNKKKEMVKVREGFGNGVSVESFQEVESDLSSSDIQDYTNTLIKAGQGLGLIEKDGNNINLNNTNVVQTNIEQMSEKEITNSYLDIIKK